MVRPVPARRPVIGRGRYWIFFSIRPEDADQAASAEHTFRVFKQVPGWTAPKIRDPACADR